MEPEKGRKGNCLNTHPSTTVPTESLPPYLTLDRVSSNETETRELRKQVDVLVGLLGQHGVKVGETGMNTNNNEAGAGQPGLGIGGSNLGTGFSQSDNTSVAVVQADQQPRGSHSGDLFTYDTSGSYNAAPSSALRSLETQNRQTYSAQHTQLSEPLNQTFSNHDHVISHSPNTGGLDTSVFQQTGMSPNDEPSHGTLVISASGRSKYLGPSAASEWLKDVSRWFLWFVSFQILILVARSPGGVSSTFTKDSKPFRPCLAYSRSGTECIPVHIQPASTFVATHPQLSAPKRGSRYPH